MLTIKRIYFWAGIYGIILLLPLFLFENEIAKHFPPVTNRPEQYYGFIGVALAWQFAFILISREPVRYQLFMIPAILEKLLPAGAVIGLFLLDRVNIITMIPFIVDFVIGLLFIFGYFYTVRNSKLSCIKK